MDLRFSYIREPERKVVAMGIAGGISHEECSEWAAGACKGAEGLSNGGGGDAEDC